jgi:uncharacterized protein (TIGR02147 family)
MSAWKPDIFTYLDHRAYLGDFYQAAKAHSSVYSFRYFARRAGYSSPNFLKRVMDGERNLTAESAQRVARALDLDAEEERFFCALVAFNQAEGVEERNEAFAVIAAHRGFQQARRLDLGLFDYLSRWYYPAVREMVDHPGFVEDAGWIAARLLPPIQPAQARECLDALLALGLLARDAQGRLQKQEPCLATGHEVRALAVGNYHRQMLQRAADAITLAAPRRRHLNAVTLSVRADQIAEVKARINALIEQVALLGDQTEGPEQVYQLNVQFFPLTNPEEAP